MEHRSGPQAIYAFTEVGQLVTKGGKVFSPAMPVSAFRRMVAMELGLDCRRPFAIVVLPGADEELEALLREVPHDS